MLEELKRQADLTYTENGAVTHSSTGSDLLNLFASVGALRDAPAPEIQLRFLRAYTENPSFAMKLAFYARDIRGGLGERRAFRVITDWLAANAPESLRKNLPLIPEYGRWDDVVYLLDSPARDSAFALIRQQWELDLKALEAGRPISLLGKWLPSANASSAETCRLGKTLARHLGLSQAEYRRCLTALRGRIKLLENSLRNRDYSFDYSKQPSKAMLKYRAAFLRNDRARYLAFLDRVNLGEARLHTGTLLPYELVSPYLRQGEWGRCGMSPVTEDEKRSLNTSWASLADFCVRENALAVVDTSGSMYRDLKPMPAAVALSLGLYFAERAKGPFHNHFITFSSRPQLVELKGDSFADRLRYAASFSEIANTNLAGVFNLLLTTAVEHALPQSELPEKLYIISDMEFDACVNNADQTVFDNAAARFAAHGYRLPTVVFWNVCSRNRQQPVRKEKRGVVLVSGCSPRIFSIVMRGSIDPYTFMLSVLEDPRYAGIEA